MKKLVVLAAFVAVSTAAQAGDLIRLKATGPIQGDNLQRFVSLEQAKSEDIFLVQWKGSVHESEKAELRELGLEILSYIPDDAFLVQGDSRAAEKAARLDFVRVLVPYVGAWKVEPELARHGIFSFRDEAEVSIQTAPGADLAAVMAALSHPVHVGNGLVAGGASDVGGLYKLANRADVLWIERYLPFRPMHLSAEELGVAPGQRLTAASQTGYESGTKIINADAMHAQGLHGEGQIVAVADTGLDTGDMNTLLPDFQGQVKAGIAIGLGGKSWGDPMMHGTHVSGSILGSGRSSNGLIKGAAFNAKLVMEGMWSDIMNNIMPPAIPKLFDAAYKEGARIHSNSWGAPNSNGRYDNWCVLTDTWLFDNQDFLAMFAAGNDGADLSKDGVIDQGSVSSPGSAKNVLTVGASKNYLLEGGIQRMMKELRGGGDKWGVEPIASSRLSEDAKGMAGFSSRGPTADGRLKPEIVAPGTNIVSARDRHPKADPATMSWGLYDDNYVFMGGTSMATPVAAGGVALVRQYLVKQLGTETVSSALVKATVANMATDLYPGQFGERSSGQEQPTRRPNNHEGWGLVNLEGFAPSTLLLQDEKVGLATGQQKEFAVGTALVGRPLRITLAYTDAPGTASAQRTLVNDLDLTVVDPSGRTFYPNGRSDKDSVNNMEQVDVLSAVAGSYRVIVRGGSVPQGKNGAQPYALVVSTGR